MIFNKFKNRVSLISLSTPIRLCLKEPSKIIAVTGLVSYLLMSSGCIWKPDLAPSQLKQWELPSSQYFKVDDTNVHVVHSSLCNLSSANAKYQKPITNVFETNIANDNHTSLNSELTDSKLRDSQKNGINANTAKPETILLLHGTSASVHTWNGWVEALENDYCVVRMDLPAFGLTGPYKNPDKRYNMDNYVNTVVSVMDLTNIDKAIIGGNSLGGGIAWLTTLRNPDRISRLILVDSSGYKFTPKHMPLGFKLAQYPILDPIVAKVLPKSLVRKSIESVYADDSKITEELVTRYFELTRREGNREALTKRMRENLSMQEVTQLGSIHQPTLIIWGAKDDLIPIESAYKFDQDIPNSQLVIFNDLGHVPQEEDPVATVEAVKQFLNETKTH